MLKRVVIIGSGPAAWTSALYLGRAELKPVVFAGFKKGGQRGGQLVTTTEVENYPGFPVGISGPELMQAMEEQARRFDIEVYEEDVHEVVVSEEPFIVKGSSNCLQANAVIIATGAYAKRLNIPGDKEFWSKGISACAVCDGALPIFRGQEIAIVGGGDTACEEAIFMTKYASKVYLILRKNTFRASQIMRDRVLENGKIEVIYEHQVIEAYGERLLKGVVLKESHSDKTRKIDVAGLFYAIGHEPNTDFLSEQIATDDDGYILAENGSTYTSVEGVFAAGDVADKKYRQAITAAGYGCMAALDCERWLATKGIHTSSAH